MDKPIIKSYLFDITSLDDATFNELLSRVKKYRREKIEKLSIKKNKYLSLAVELLIIKACKDFGLDYLEEEIIFNESGKPAFKSGKYYFNTAHSGDFALCVISNIEVGCDIEKIKENRPRVAERVFSLYENQIINISPNPAETFYRIWTLKESYMKCIGKGFNIPMNSFEMDLSENDVVVKGNKDYQFIEQKYNDYRIAFCFKIKQEDKDKYIQSTTLIKIN